LNKVIRDKKRLLNSFGISVLFHIIFITGLGLWSLKIPVAPGRTKPLTIVIEPDIIVPQVHADHPATNKKNVEVKKVITSVPPEQKAPLPKPSPAPETAAQPVSHSKQENSPQEQASSPQPPESSIPLPVATESLEPLFSPRPLPVPKPGDSKIVYGDETAVQTKDTVDTPKNIAESNTKVLSDKEISKLSSSLHASDSPTSSSAKLPSVAENSLPSVTLPQTIELSLKGAGTHRRPLTMLDLAIPGELLEKIDHDSLLTVRFTLMPDGHIMLPAVVVSQVSPQIETKVFEALRKWEFNVVPLSQTQKSIEGQITIHFKVK